MDIFTQLSLLIVTAAILAGVARILRQPLIIGYILTGIVLGPAVLGYFKDTSSLEIFSVLGISILLFIVGLNLSPKVAQEVGHVSLIAGAVQVISTVIIGYLICISFGFSPIAAIYVGIALSFSSTIIVLKLLSDKKDMEKLYGRITLGILIVQDIVAAGALVIMATFADTGNSQNSLVASFIWIAIKGIASLEVLVLISYYVLPKFEKFFSSSQEYLLLFALAWGFGIASLFKFLGFSVEIGALLAGISLSVTPYASDISSKLKNLRDFFLVLFFIVLGTNINISSVSESLLLVLIFTLVTVLVKPLLSLMAVGLLGHNKKTALGVGLSLGQLSEFSLVLLIMGVRLGHVPQTLLSNVTAAALLSFIISAYAISKLEFWSQKLAPLFSFLNKFAPKSTEDLISNYEAILFGCNRVGYDFMRVFSRLGQGFLAVDFDPDLIKELRSKGVNCQYGDAEDGEYLDEIHVYEAKIVVSTIPDFETNFYLLHKIRAVSKETVVILMSYNVEDALHLYGEGASYVIMPHFIGGQYAAEIAQSAGFDVENMHAHRKRHMDYLLERRALGHAHPKWVNGG